MCIRKVDVSAAGDISDSLVAGLCELLTDAVNGGASVGFLRPVKPASAHMYWQGLVQSMAAPAKTGPKLWVAEDSEGRITGSIQVELCSKENGRHRAEVQKLLVHSSARQAGIGSALLAVAEQFAAAEGCTLLVLDTEAGSVAETLYTRRGWTRSGEIPAYAASPDGELHATVFYFKIIQHKL